MVKKTYNILFLVLFHLWVYLTPLAVKDVHFHPIKDYPVSANGHEKYFLPGTKACVICQFEIRNLLSHRITKFSFIKHEGLVHFSEPVLTFDKPSFVFYSHRAPPFTAILPS